MISLDACAVYTYAIEKKQMEKLGFTPNLLDPRFQKALLMLDEYLKVGKQPVVEDITKLFGEDILEENHYPVHWLVRELKKRYLQHYLGVKLDTAIQHIKGNAPEEALAALQKLISDAPGVEEQADLADELTNQIPELKERAQEALMGMAGLPCGWPSFNETTGGFRPSETTYFIARPGIGKTWMLVVLCCYFWSLRFSPEGYAPKILFITPEISKIDVAERAFAIMTKTSYSKLVSGLVTQQQINYSSSLDNYQNIPGFRVMAETDGLTPERIRQAIELYEPDIVAIDAIYEINWSTGKRDEKNPLDNGISLVRKWSKSLWPNTMGDALWPDKNNPEKKWIHIMVSSQENREGDEKKDDKGKKAEAPLYKRIAFTGAIEQRADRIFFLKQTPDMYQDKVLEMVRAKIRKQGLKRIDVIKLNWDLDEMSLSEYGSSGEPEIIDVLPTF